MALGELVLDDSGQITGIRVLSTDASGTNLEISAQLTGTIRGVGHTTLWTYTVLQRPDGSLYGGVTVSSRPSTVMSSISLAQVLEKPIQVEQYVFAQCCTRTVPPARMLT